MILTMNKIGLSLYYDLANEWSAGLKLNKIETFGGYFTKTQRSYNYIRTFGISALYHTRNIKLMLSLRIKTLSFIVN